MSLIPLRPIAYSTIVIPVLIFVIGAILFRYRPIHKQTVGIILVALGSLGIPIYSLVFYFSIVRGSSNIGFIVSLSMVAVQILSFGLGIIALTKRSVPIQAIDKHH